MVEVAVRTLAELREAGAPALFERDPSVIKAALVAKFEEKSGRTLYPGQTEMFLIETATYALSMLNEAAQTAVEQNTVVWAEGRHLEDRAANVATFRLLAQKARATLRFTLVMERPDQVEVAAGTRVGGPGALVLATDADLVIPAGDIEGEVTATALVPGGAWNGLAAGTVADLLDPIAWVAGAENIDAVAGGSSVEEQERFRERAANALYKIAKTGPRKGYREHVRDVHPDIVDVEVIRPEPGVINIYPLLSTGAPDAPLKAAILAHLDPETLRPMGDDVYVLDPEEEAFEFGVTVRCLAAVPGLQAAAEATVRAVFRRWELTLGAQVAPIDVTSAVRRLAGVTDVETDLEFTDLAAHQFAAIADLTVTVLVVPNV